MCSALYVIIHQVIHIASDIHEELTLLQMWKPSSAVGCTAEWMAQWETGRPALPLLRQVLRREADFMGGGGMFSFWVLGLASSSGVLIIFKLKKKSFIIFVIGDLLLTNLKVSCNKMLLINFNLTDFCLNVWGTELFLFIIAFLNSYRAVHIDSFLTNDIM